MKRLGKLNCVTVWLVLLGFLCGLMVPAVAVARVHREIDTEGDPLDGLGLTDGGAGTGGSSGDTVPPSESSTTDFYSLIGFGSVSYNGRVVVQSVRIDGRIVYTFWFVPTSISEVGGD